MRIVMNEMRKMYLGPDVGTIHVEKRNPEELMTLLQTYGLSLDQFTWQSFVDWGRVDRVCLGESMRTM